MAAMRRLPDEPEPTPTPTPTATTPTQLDTAGTLVLCHALEELPPSGWGMLAVADRDGTDLGGVFVHDGRVAGAIAPEVELARGTLPPREILLRRTAAAIAILGTGGVRRWSPGVGHGFAPRETFSVTEVLIATIAAHQARAGRAVRAIQMAPWPRDAIILAYAVDHAAEMLVPVAIGGDTNIGVRAALDLGRIGQDALVAAGCLRGRPELVLAGVGAGDTAIATWADNDLLYVARVSGPAAVERLLRGWGMMREAEFERWGTGR
jgi:hypothetical protein